MSLKPQEIGPIPEETARVARGVYPKGNVCMRMRDELGSIYQDEAFAHLFSHTGQLAEAPWRLALVTVMQFAEGLSDRQAADAVRSCIDFKYALGLELSDPGFDHTVLSAFRARLVAGNSEQMLLDTMLTLFKERGWLKARGKQRTDSTHVLAKIRALNRVLCVGETLRHALNCLAIVAPDWLCAHSQPEWVERDVARMEDARTPLGDEARHAFAEMIGADGASVLNAIYEATALGFLREIPAIETLRQVWVQNYTWIEGKIRWRSSEDIPPAAQYIGSPYDVEAHYSKKRSTTWVGYKVHLTETCEKDSPHLITPVETTAAPVSDDARTALIHEGLKGKDLLPKQHIVDTGYVDAKLLIESQQNYQIDLLGPTCRNHQWQANQQKGFDADHFLIDWQRQQATCPEGHTSSSWTPAIDNRTNEVIKIKFSRHRLSSLSEPEALHAIAAPCASHGHHPTQGAVRGFAGQATARKHQGLQDPVCYSRRRRGDHFARGPHNGLTPLSLHWPRAHASATCGDSSSHQCRSSHALARWRPSCKDQAITLCPTTSSGCLRGGKRIRHQYQGCVRAVTHTLGKVQLCWSSRSFCLLPSGSSCSSDCFFCKEES